MAACNEEGEDANLFDTVRAVAMELCPRLGICIPVGKDSLSMRTVWQDSRGEAHRQVAPLSLCVSAFAPVRDVRRTVTADLKRVTASTLLLIDLGHGRNRCGASALAQVYNRVGNSVRTSSLRGAGVLSRFCRISWSAITAACHDRSTEASGRPGRDSWRAVGALL